MKRIKSTRELKVNDVLRVYKKGFGYAVVSVIDIHDQFISAKADKEFVASVKQGDVLDAYFWSDHMTSCEFALEILGLFSIDLQIIFFRHTNRIACGAERKCLQADVSMPFPFFIFSVENSDKVFSSTRVKMKKGRILKLSDRDAIFRYSGSLRNCSFVKGHLGIKGEDIDVIGRLDRGPGTAKNTYLMHFSGLAGKDREKIMDFVYSVYRER